MTRATGRSFRGVPPDERQAQRRRQLVEAGLDAFGTRGFHLTGVREICVAARLTERYFYESFKNREALFLAVYEEAVERVRSAVMGALASAAASAAFPQGLPRAGLQAMLVSYRDDPRLARILLVESLAAGPAVGGAQYAVTASFAEMIAGIAKSLFPGMAEQGLDPQLVGNALFGSTLYISMQWAFGGFREPLEQILTHCLLVYEALFAEATRRNLTPAQTSRAGRARRRRPSMA
jgi:AcrR family transcriptional regulator